MFNQDLYTFSSLWGKMSTLKIQFLLQGCRAILVDKDRNPKVQITSYFKHGPSNIDQDLLQMANFI
jgi:hypothetical protein